MKSIRRKHIDQYNTYIYLIYTYVDHFKIPGGILHPPPPPPCGPANYKYNFYLIYMLSSNRFHTFWLE